MVGHLDSVAQVSEHVDGVRKRAVQLHDVMFVEHASDVVDAAAWVALKRHVCAPAQMETRFPGILYCGPAKWRAIAATRFVMEGAGF